MPKSEKIYPQWVQEFRSRGTTVKKKGDTYYLYKRTSRRVPGKKYPQPVDTYIGVITPEGIVKSEKKKVSVKEVEVKEYGFSKAVWELCPEDWKKPLGKDWEDVLRIIILNWSPQSYLYNEDCLKKKDDLHYQINAQASSLSRRMYKAHGAGMKELEGLKTIYLVSFDGEKVVSKIYPDQRILIDSLGIDMEVS